MNPFLLLCGSCRLRETYISELSLPAAWLLLGGRSIMLRGFYVILGTTQEFNKHRYVRQIHEVILPKKKKERKSKEERVRM